jgi:hypothetical protein
MHRGVTPVIPPGWRLLREDETAVRFEDYCKRQPGSQDIYMWERVDGIHGYSPYLTLGGYGHDYVIIRKLKPGETTTPKPEKEWLNPWD